MRHSLGWRQLNPYRPPRRENLATDIAGAAALLLLAYIIVGGISLLAVGLQDDIPYMSFWHAPWRWLFEILEEMF